MQMKVLVFLAVLQIATCRTVISDPCGPAAGFLMLLGKNCDIYKLQSIKSADADRFMKIGHRGNVPEQVPDSLLGLHWADELISLAGSTWDEKKQAVVMKVYGDRMWGFEDSDEGAAIFKGARMAGYAYNFHFNAEKTFAHVVPSVLDGLSIPEGVADFDMYLVGDGHWVRNSTFLGGLVGSSYDLRQVVTPSGARTADWDEHYASMIGKDIGQGKILKETTLVAFLQ